MESKDKHLSLLSILLVRLRFIMIFVVVGFLVAEWGSIMAHVDRFFHPLKPEEVTQSADEWFCPMHPNVVRSAPGNCPICGMELSGPRKRGERQKLPEGVNARLQLSPLRIRQAGVATTEIQFQTLVREVRAVGFIEYDERRISHLSARVAGRVDELYLNFLGTKVSKGDPLYKLYSPDVTTSEEEYLAARKGLQEIERAAQKDANAVEQARRLMETARQRLALWGISDEQIAAVGKSGKPDTHITIYCGLSGEGGRPLTVIEKDIHEGHYLKEGDDPYTVVDDSVVWMQAEVFERDMGVVEVGEEMAVTTEAYPGESFTGTVSFISPTLSPETRTVKVRVDVPNLEGRLKPGMYTTAILRVPAGRHGEIYYTCCAGCPGREEHGGKCKSCSKALVKRGGIAGVAAAKEVFFTCPMHPEVVSDQPGTCPKCNMNLERRERDPVSALATYYACPMHPEVTSASPGVCGKCGMALEKKQRKVEPARKIWVCDMDAQTVFDKPGKCPKCGMNLEEKEVPAGGRVVYTCPSHPTMESDKPGKCKVAGCGKELEYAIVEGTSRVVQYYVCPLDPVHTSDDKLVCPECGCEMKHMEYEQILAVPFSSVIDTGDHKVVFVDRGNGVFDAVELKLGPRAGEFYPVLGGEVKEGDRVVTAGAFLLDAETRLNPAASAAYFGASGQEKDK